MGHSLGRMESGRGRTCYAGAWRYIDPLQVSLPGLVGCEAVVVPVLVSQVTSVEIHRFWGRMCGRIHTSHTCTGICMRAVVLVGYMWTGNMVGGARVARLWRAVCLAHKRARYL